jgi:hypothetical protein
VLKNGTSDWQGSFPYLNNKARSCRIFSKCPSLFCALQPPETNIRIQIVEMTRLRCHSSLLLLIINTVSRVRCDDMSTVSLCNAGSSVWQLRSCAVVCIGNAFGAYGRCDQLADQLSCPGQGVLNSCFCRNDLLPVAVSIVSACVMAGCQSNTNDVASAIASYTNYCSSTGIASPPIVIATTTTVGAVLTSNGPPVIISTVTVTVSSAAGSRSTAPVEITSSAYRLLFTCAIVRKLPLQAL